MLGPLPPVSLVSNFNTGIPKSMSFFFISPTNLLFEGLVVESDGGGSLLIFGDCQKAQTQESKAESQHPALQILTNSTFFRQLYGVICILWKGCHKHIWLFRWHVLKLDLASIRNSTTIIFYKMIQNHIWIRYLLCSRGTKARCAFHRCFSFSRYREGIALSKNHQKVNEKPKPKMK